MDERLQKALEFSNYTLTLNNQKKNIKNRVAQLQTVHYNGGVFKADSATIAMVQALIEIDNQDSVMVDTKENPIRINRLREFREKLLSAYNSAMTEYEIEYDKLKKARNINKLMDW